MYLIRSRARSAECRPHPGVRCHVRTHEGGILYGTVVSGTVVAGRVVVVSGGQMSTPVGGCVT